MTDRWHERAADFFVGLVNPTKAALRKHWRRVERDSEYREGYELGLRMSGYRPKPGSRAYKAASFDKNHTQWPHSSPRSADAEINGDLNTLRNRSRAANRDDALSSGITHTLARGVVGTGLRPQARTGDERKDAALEAVWAERAPQLAQSDGNMIHGSHQRLVYFKRNEDGDVFLRPAVAAPGEPLWIEVIEADRVRTPADAEPEDSKGRIISGVEKDGFGRVTHYWILQKHPGDWVLWDTKMGRDAYPLPSTFSKKYFDRVPAASVCHDRSSVTRPGQTRGVPRCHAVMQDLRDLDLLILASLKRTQIAACLATFITSPLGTTDIFQATAEDYGYQLDDKIEPGMIFRLFPGEQVQFLNPQAGVPDLDKFVFLLARRIGAAIGLSPEAILRDWKGISYSAARTVKIDDRQTFRGERSDFGGHVLSWEWRVVMEDELLRGNQLLLEAGVTVEDLRHVEWIGDEEPWVDPQAEAAATEIMLRLGLTSEMIECTRLGRDFRSVTRDRLMAQKIRRELAAELGVSDAGEPPAGSEPPLKVVPPDEAPSEFDDGGAGEPLDPDTWGKPGSEEAA